MRIFLPFLRMEDPVGVPSGASIHTSDELSIAPTGGPKELPDGQRSSGYVVQVLGTGSRYAMPPTNSYSLSPTVWRGGCSGTRLMQLRSRHSPTDRSPSHPEDASGRRAAAGGYGRCWPCGPSLSAAEQESVDGDLQRLRPDEGGVGARVSSKPNEGQCSWRTMRSHCPRI